MRQKQTNFEIVSKILLAFFILGYEGLVSAQNRNSRDRNAEDFFGKKETLRRNEGPPRFRLPIELSRFRTIDGTINNVFGITWGMAGGNLRRTIPNDYADGISAPAGANRKSARAISNIVCNQSESIPSSGKLSSMVWQWGQFLDHDLTLTETAEPFEAFPILVPTGDQYFDPLGAGEQQISLFRSAFR